MQSSNQESATSGPINLLKRYSFESNGQSYQSVLDSWLERFPLSWVNLALVESLHQGRYKVVSVEQILTLWQRRGKPSYHFNHDFERLVSNNLPQGFDGNSTQSAPYRPSSTRHSSRRHRYFSLDARKPFNEPFTSQPEIEKPVKKEEPESASPQPFWPHLGLDVSSNNDQSISETSSTKYPVDGDTPDRIEIEAQTSDVLLTNLEQEPALEEASEQSENKDTNFQISVPEPSSQGNTVNPIHQFVPQTAAGVFHEKLTAMAQINV